MLTRSFNDYLKEASFAAEQPVAGDVLDIELSETEVFECIVVENNSGTIIVESSKLYETLDLTEELDDDESDEDEQHKKYPVDVTYVKMHGSAPGKDPDNVEIHLATIHSDEPVVSGDSPERWAYVVKSSPEHKELIKQGYRLDSYGHNVPQSYYGHPVVVTGDKSDKSLDESAEILRLSGLSEAEYQGRKVELNKPMKGDVAKSKVYVRDPKTGNVKKVNFGDKNMRIKKNIPARRRSFRARHHCENPGPKTKARYWSCRAW